MPSSLRSRLVLLLILANLPAAALAIGVTVQGRNTEIQQREQAIIQRAALVAARAGLTLGIAEGVADTLAANGDVAEGGPQCANELRSALSFRPEYVGAIVSDKDGSILCSSGNLQISDASRSSLFRSISNTADVGDVVFLPEHINDEDQAVMMSRAFTAPNNERRAVGILLRRDAFDAIFRDLEDATDTQSALALVRGEGAIVTEIVGGDRSRDWHPSSVLPSVAPGDPARGLHLAALGGQPYHYAIAPVRGTLSNVVLATPYTVITRTDWMRFLAALSAPLLMLVLGILAVFAGVDRLVLRWIKRFRQVTASYALGNYGPRIAGLDNAPSELAELGEGFNDMAGRVQDRSHALETAIQGKNDLLRELHHRVKNNFQMIASLLALQRRELPVRLRTLLRVPEDRVLAMAAAYKASYATGDIGRVSAFDLLRDVTGQLRQSFGVSSPLLRVGSAPQPVWLDLDQAVPLGLLVSEILTAALEREDAASAPIQIDISRSQSNVVQIGIASRKIADHLPSTGLAARLVQAYRSQIGAELTIQGDDVIVIEMPLNGEGDNHSPHPGRVDLAG